MCTGGGGGSGGDGGASAREAERQAKISQGYDTIQKIFGGYKSGTGNVDSYTDGGTYYLQDGTPVKYGTQQRAIAAPAKGSEMPGAQVTRGQQTEGQQLDIYGRPVQAQQYNTVSGYYGPDGNFVDMGGNQLFSGVSTTKGFDDDFYNARSQSYQDYATPQLNDQFADAQKTLEFALARNGRLNSSVAGEQRAKLLKDYEQQKIGIADKGLQYANDARKSVEGARSDLISLNTNTADPRQVATEAQNRLAGLQAAPAYDPLAPLFVNTGDALGSQADLERRSNARYNTGLFTPSAVSSGAGSGRYIK